MAYITKDKEIQLLRKNVKDLQGQLQNAYIRIKKLNEALHFEHLTILIKVLVQLQVGLT